MACPKPYNKSSFSAFTMPLYLAFRGRWLDLAYEISGVWALGLKLISKMHLNISAKIHFLLPKKSRD
jgi:hypothetical protein